jgi:hypothetical protein
MAALELLQGGPLLTLPSDVLPFVLAQQTVLGRQHGLCVLNATGGADVVRHVLNNSVNGER